MATTEIIQLGHSVLREVAKDVPLTEMNSQSIKEIIELMKNTLRAAPGVGLAAPQVGISLRIVIIEDREEYSAAMLPNIREERGRRPVAFHVLFNPKITWMSEEKVSFFEGCLSVEGFARITPRAKQVHVEYHDENGNQQIVNADGWYARILQHEIDHLNAQLYIDIASQKTEIMMTPDNKRKWLNASIHDIQAYALQCC